MLVILWEMNPDQISSSSSPYWLNVSHGKLSIPRSLESRYRISFSVDIQTQNNIPRTWWYQNIYPPSYTCQCLLIIKNKKWRISGHTKLFLITGSVSALFSWFEANFHILCQGCPNCGSRANLALWLIFLWLFAWLGYFNTWNFQMFSAQLYQITATNRPWLKNQVY